MQCSKDNCGHDAVTGSDKCARHTREKSRVHRYRVENESLKSKLEEMASIDYAASLKGEVELARAILEERLNGAKSEAELVAAHQAVNSSLAIIEKLVGSMVKFGISSGELLTKETAARMMYLVTECVAQHLDVFKDDPKYPGMVDKITEDLLTIAESMRNEDGP